MGYFFGWDDQPQTNQPSVQAIWPKIVKIVNLRGSPPFFWGRSISEWASLGSKGLKSDLM